LTHFIILAENWCWARNVNGRDRDLSLPKLRRWQFLSRWDWDETSVHL